MIAAAPESGLEIWRDERGCTAAFGHAGPGHSWLCMPPVATFRFDARERSVTVLPHPGSRGDTREEALYRAAVPLALHAFGEETLHASAVLTPSGLAAFCAVAGTGKSTIAKALASRGHRLWADDAVIMRIEGSEVRAEPLPFHLRLRPEAAAHFALSENARPAWICPEEPARLASVFVLRRDPALAAPFEIRRLDAARAFPALLANAYCFSLRDPARKRRMMAHYASVARIVPCRELVFRPGLGHLAAMAAAIEREVP